MRQNDRYVKIILTIIALALVTIACNQISNPGLIARAGGKFADVQFVTGGDGVLAINTSTGDVWNYSFGGMYGFKAQHLAKIQEIGKAPIADSSAR